MPADRRIAILTPDPADRSYADHWPAVLERLGLALKAQGLTVEPAPWTDHIRDASRLAAYDLVLPLVVWGYHRDHGRWLDACRAWTAAGVRLANPASVLTWNSDKTYLARLADRGVAIPPTLWREAPTQADLAEALDRFGADRLVVKPTVSGGAWKTLRLSRDEALGDGALDGGPDGPAMIQPYLTALESEGELSLLFFGGRFSHAVRKTPVAGDFRIQSQFGGRYAPEPSPPAAAMDLAAAVLAAIDEPLLYARIDVARGPDGGWLLMEAELIEPDFYLACAPDGGAAFARAVADSF